MTVDATNMATPLTRGEFREELERALAPLATKAELEPLATKAELEPLATKADLEQRIAPLATKADLEQRIAPLATKAELEQRIASLATKEELARAIAPLATKAELVPLATKVDLEIWGGALLARIESGEKRLVERITESINQAEQRLLGELARHTRALFESMSTLVSPIDEKYADLPGRVRRLEGAVFESKDR
jgi:hypothetical protein